MDLLTIARNHGITEEDLIQIIVRTLDEVIGPNTGKILMNYIQASTAEGLIGGLERVFGPGFEVLSNKMIEKMEAKAPIIRLELLRGNLRLEGKSFVLINAGTMQEICRLLEVADTETLRAVGSEIGMSLVMESEFYTLGEEDDSFIKELVQEQLDNLSRFGWGRFTLGQMDSEKNQFMVQAYNSVFAQRRKGEKPLCGMGERILEGVFLRLFDDPYVRCLEVTCSAQGFPCCIFQIKCRLC